MKTTINFATFCDAFNNFSRNDQFSYEAKQALFDYLEKYEDQTGEQIELDIISICCEYTEYDSVEDCLKEYINIPTREALEDRTTVIDCSNGHIIIAQF